MTLVSAIPLDKMDGRRLYYSFIAGARNVIEHQVELNKINVFPVNDGDTGSNLASTIRAVIDTLLPHRSYKITADRISEAILVNARGNSGIIFAQFIYGMSNETVDSSSITTKQFAESIKESVRYIYEAVAEPVEGTMLTVIRDWANYIYENRNIISDFNKMLVSSLDILKKSLHETTSKLHVLSKANVVDAGAKGFVLFVEGIIDFIMTRDLKDIIRVKTEATLPERIEETISENVDNRYCTEALIKGSTVDKEELSSILERYGNSIVIAGSDTVRRIHIHTDTPAELIDELRKTGTLTYQKADDMVRQSEVVYKRKWNIALVTDSTCDLSQELIDHYQINMLPINLFFGENHYLDKYTIHPEQFYSLLEENKDYPKSSQVNEKTFISLFSHLASHYDSIIAVHLSDKFSGTFNSARKAAGTISKEFGKPVTIINSRNISGGLGLLVLRAAEAIEKGYKHDQVVKLIGEWADRTRIYISVRDIKYLIKGGRVSAVKGLIARLLNINPIVSIDTSGKAIVFGKAFNQRMNMEKVMAHIEKVYRDLTIWNYIILHADNQEGAEWFESKMHTLTGMNPVSVVNISPVIGANSGTGAVAVAFLPD